MKTDCFQVICEKKCIFNRQPPWIPLLSVCLSLCLLCLLFHQQQLLSWIYKLKLINIIEINVVLNNIAPTW